MFVYLLTYIAFTLFILHESRPCKTYFSTRCLLMYSSNHTCFKHTHTHARTHARTHTRTHTHTHTDRQTGQARTHARTHTHTHTHTHTVFSVNSDHMSDVDEII